MKKRTIAGITLIASSIFVIPHILKDNNKADESLAKVDTPNIPNIIEQKLIEKYSSLFSNKAFKTERSIAVTELDGAIKKYEEDNFEPAKIYEEQVNKLINARNTHELYSLNYNIYSTSKDDLDNPSKSEIEKLLDQYKTAINTGIDQFQYLDEAHQAITDDLNRYNQLLTKIKEDPNGIDIQTNYIRSLTTEINKTKESMLLNRQLHLDLLQNNFSNIISEISQNLSYEIDSEQVATINNSNTEYNQAYLLKPY